MSSGEFDRRKAERAAGRLEEQLEAGVIPGQSDGFKMAWGDFRARYEDEWLQPLSVGSKNGWRTAANHYENALKPRWLYDVTASTLSQYRGHLEGRGLSPAAVQSYMHALRAGLSWASSMGWIEPIPLIRQRRSSKAVATMRGRPITGEEFERMLAVAPEVRPNDHALFVHFMKGLWYSGLRIDELNRLSWEAGSPAHVVIGEPSMIVFLGGQKNRKDGFLPAPPPFWQLVDRPGVSRRGQVFPIRGRWGDQMTTNNIGRRIRAMGRAAGVIVDPNKNKFASAHDLRRAYLTRIAATATMSQTQTLARHSDPKTTSQFYVRHEAEALAKALGWA